MQLIPFDGQLDDKVPAGLVPFDGKLDDEEGFLDKARGAVETGISMVAGAPSEIAAGLSGIGSLMIGEGVDKAVDRMDAVRKSNFGFGQFTPTTETGQRYQQNVGEALESVQQGGGNVGAAIGGVVGRENAGRYVGELLTGTAMELLEPTAIFGAAKGAAMATTRPKARDSRINTILQEDAATKSVAQPTTPVKEDPTRINETRQTELFDQPEQGRMVSPYEATPGDWRIDENGMPVRVDLSLDAQAAQTPLQRDLFGEAIDPSFPRDPNQPLGPRSTGDIEGVERFSDPVNFRNDPENQTSLQFAMDTMQPDALRVAVEQTQLGREMQASGELEAAKMAAEPQAANQIPLSKTKRGKQSGVIDSDIFLKDFPNFVTTTIKNAVGELKPLFRGIKEDYTTADRPMLGTLGEGIYLTESKTMANNYARGGTEGRQVRAYYVDIKNPYEMEIGSPEHQNLILSSREDRKAFSDQVKANGFDGVVLKSGDEIKEAMVFSPLQARNAFSVPSKQLAVPKGQRGVVKVDWSDRPKLSNALVPSSDGSFIPENPDIGAAIEAAKKSGKDGKQWNYVQSGGTSTAMKSGSPIIQAASEVVQNAVKRADLAIRNTVFPVEAALRSLPKKDLTMLAQLMKEEMIRGERINGDVLVKNLTEKQLRAYKFMREMFDRTLDAQNEARLAKGQEPISPQEAYVSSRWQGDFRQPVYDANGKLVWYLAASTKMGLNAQAKALKKMDPSLVIDEAKAHTVKSGRNETDLQSAYSTMIDILGRDDPAIQKLKLAIEEQMSTESELSMAQSKHFEPKSGVRGFAGDRPFMDSTKDAVEMFRQQVQYAKNAFKWSELQKVSEDIKAIVSDPDLQKTQPNNIHYIREYFKNAVGMSDAKLIQALDDTIRESLGISPVLVDRAVGDMKNFFITQKLVLSAGYMASNVIQSANVLPYLSDLATKGVRGNPITAVAAGMFGALPMMLAHYMGATGRDYMSAPLVPQFLKDAFRYAEDNGVTSRSMYDEAPLEANLSRTRAAIGVAQKATNMAETLARSMAFMTYAQWLKDSGKYPDQMKLFQKAEELTNMSMVDYRETERPLMFSKLGAIGNALNTLQTFPVSYFNQYAYMFKQAIANPKVGWAGLATMLAVQYALAGAMGIPGFEDTDKLYKWIRDNVVSTSTWNKMMQSPFFADPKAWMIDNFGQASVYGALSDQTGIGMTSRVSAPTAGAMLQSPVGPITDIAGQLGSVGKALIDPTDPVKLGQAAMKVAPVGVQGLLEQAPFMEGITYTRNPDGSLNMFKSSDLEAMEKTVTRSPAEQQVRNFGVRSQREILERDLAYGVSSQNLALDRRAGELVGKFYSAARRGDVEKAKELATLYTELTGKTFSATQLENQLNKEIYTEAQRATLRSNTAQKLVNAARMNRILNKENNGNN